MKLNCDLGEFEDNNDADIMPYIDMANIACGFHGSTPLTIKTSIKLAQQHQVTIGAHPSYPDIENFGRKSMSQSSEELVANLHYQIGALQAFCLLENTALSYVKPHGALYNDMMQNLRIFNDICHAIASFNQQTILTASTKPLALMIQAVTDITPFKRIAKQFNITLWFEAFADRGYQDSGLLLPRNKPGAILVQTSDVIERCHDLLNQQPLRSVNNEPLKLNIDTLCVHGDTPNALDMIKALRFTIDQNTPTKTNMNSTPNE